MSSIGAADIRSPVFAEVFGIEAVAIDICLGDRSRGPAASRQHGHLAEKVARP